MAEMRSFILIHAYIHAMCMMLLLFLRRTCRNTAKNASGVRKSQHFAGRNGIAARAKS